MTDAAALGSADTGASVALPAPPPVPEAAPAPPQGWLVQAREQAVAIDEAIYAAVATTRTPGLDSVVARLSDAANFSMIWFAVGGAVAVAGGPKGRRAAVEGIAAIGVASLLVNQGLKRIAPRSRPDRESELSESIRDRHVRMPSSTSFPSGHSASAFAFATAVSGRVRWLSAPLQGLAAAVAYSRVHTGVHYPGDVVVGSLTGIVCGDMVRWIGPRLTRSRP